MAKALKRNNTKSAVNIADGNCTLPSRLDLLRFVANRPSEFNCASFAGYLLSNTQKWLNYQKAEGNLLDRRDWLSGVSE